MLLIGGLDPSGGAGILLDCRAARAAGVHPAAVAALRTLQDGNRFEAAFPESSKALARGVSMMMSRFRVGAIKVGALGSADNVRVVAALAAERGAPVVLDPVLASTSRGALLSPEAVEVMRQTLLPEVALVTPNLDEAGILTGMSVGDLPAMREAARRLLDLGAAAALVKGGHLSGDAADLLLDRAGTEQVFRAERASSDVRGTGCALATLTASFLAQGASMAEAVERAKTVLTRAIAGAYRVGEGPAMLGEFKI